jgi:hypothetical protein
MIRPIILASGSAKPSEGMNIKHPNQSGKTFARDLVDPPGNDASCETVPQIETADGFCYAPLLTYHIADPLIAGVGKSTILNRKGEWERSRHDETLGWRSYETPVGVQMVGTRTGTVGRRIKRRVSAGPNPGTVIEGSLALQRAFR